MKIPLGPPGNYMEPDFKRDGPFHRKIVAFRPIPNTRVGNECKLDCGHVVQIFGNLKRAMDFKVLCTACRDSAN